jgi:HlyD family secretion protein
MTAQANRWLALITVAAVATLTGFYLWHSASGARLPDGLFAGNGRVEGTEIKIAARYAGRIVEIQPQEGDDVKNGDVVARLDSREARAGLAQAEAEFERVSHMLHSARAEETQRTKELAFSESQLTRTRRLFDQGNVSQQRFDRDSTAVISASAALETAKANIMQSEAQLEAAQAQIDRYEAIISETELKTPISGRVLFRIAEPGEIVQPGGNILLLVDLDRLFMTIYADEISAGKIGVGDEALIWADAYPETPFPARVTFVSSRAEFTPKEVQTREERQNLVFQVKITALDNTQRLLKPGMPGVGMVRTVPGIPWPSSALGI